MIRTKNVVFGYSAKQQFSFPDIQCNKNETLLITGLSGCGKTTFLHLLGGLLKPSSGSIIIEDTDIAGLKSRKLDSFRGENIGIVLQESHFIPSLNVKGNIQLAGAFGKNRVGSADAINALNRLGLSEFAHRRTTQLSSGQRQRVSIAQAVAKKPSVLLADEPTSGLDDVNAARVADLLSELSKEYETALVIVTHDQRLKERFKNQISL